MNKALDSRSKISFQAVERHVWMNAAMQRIDGLHGPAGDHGQRAKAPDDTEGEFVLADVIGMAQPGMQRGEVMVRE